MSLLFRLHLTKHFIMKRLLFSVFLLCCTFLSAQNTGKITIQVDNLVPNQGILRLSLYTEEGLATNKTETSFKLEVEEKQMQVVLEDILQGVYAVVCYQDLNKNNKLDFGPMGIPEEPFGFSNNPMLMSYPTFEQIKFETTDPETFLKIEMASTSY